MLALGICYPNLGCALGKGQFNLLRIVEHVHCWAGDGGLGRIGRLVINNRILCFTYSSETISDNLAIFDRVKLSKIISANFSNLSVVLVNVYQKTRTNRLSNRGSVIFRDQSNIWLSSDFAKLLFKSLNLAL